MAVAAAQDGTGDVLVYICYLNRLIRLTRSGALLPTFHEPSVDAEIYTIVPVLDGTRDFYIGGLLKTYNGAAVNHFARVHVDGSLASVFN